MEGKGIRIGVIQMLESAKVRRLKQPGADYGPWRRRYHHDYGVQSLLDRHAGSHHGPDYRRGHYGHGHLRPDQQRSHCCHTHRHEDGVPRQVSAHCRSGGGWQLLQQHSRKAQQIQRRRSSREMMGLVNTSKIHRSGGFW